ncbi:MAG: GerAB/ArcD/ProY family transporter [Oscillospiraceae bacterium]|nr:GerAB/ArcD/ProY family transporter [Oscillospiraceae bacterium]
MEKRDKMTARQLRVLTGLSLLSPMIRQLSDVPTRLAGRASWLCPLFAAVPAVLYTILLGWFLSSRREGEGLGELFCRSVGSFPGKLVSSLFGAWDVFYCGFLLCSSAERLVASVYEYGGGRAFIIVTLLSSAVFALGKLKALGRLAEAFLPVMAAALAVILALSLTGISFQNLTPVSRMDMIPAALGGLALSNFVSMQAALAFLAGSVPPEKGEIKGRAGAVCLLMLCMFLLQTAVVGGLSAGLAARLQFPFFVMVRNAPALSGVDGFEALAVALWVGTDLIFAAALLCAAAEIFRADIGGARREIFVIPAAAAALFCALFLSGNAFRLREMAETLLPAVNAVLKFGLLPLTLFIGKARKRL